MSEHTPVGAPVRLFLRRRFKVDTAWPVLALGWLWSLGG